MISYVLLSSDFGPIPAFLPWFGGACSANVKFADANYRDTANVIPTRESWSVLAICIKIDIRLSNHWSNLRLCRVGPTHCSQRRKLSLDHLVSEGNVVGRHEKSKLCSWDCQNTSSCIRPPSLSCSHLYLHNHLGTVSPRGNLSSLGIFLFGPLKSGIRNPNIHFSGFYL